MAPPSKLENKNEFRWIVPYLFIFHPKNGCVGDDLTNFEDLERALHTNV